jgi:hypothetical protein
MSSYQSKIGLVMELLGQQDASYTAMQTTLQNLVTQLQTITSTSNNTGSAINKLTQASTQGFAGVTSAVNQSTQAINNMGAGLGKTLTTLTVQLNTVNHQLNQLKSGLSAQSYQMGQGFNMLNGSLGNINTSINTVKGSAGGMGGTVTSNARSMTTGLNSVHTSLHGIYRFMVLIAAHQGLQLLGHSFIQYNQTMETTKLGIAAIYTSIGTITEKMDAHGQATDRVLNGYEKWRVASRMAGDAQLKLQNMAMSSPSTYMELLEVYQGLLAPAMSAKMTMQQTLEIALTMTNAVKAVGLPFNQIKSEAREILQGGIRPQVSTLGTALGLTNDKIKEWRAAGPGVLFDELNKRMEGFVFATREFDRTLIGSWSNLKDVAQRTLGVGLGNLFETVKNQIRGITNQLVDVKKDNNGMVVGITMKPEALQAIRDMGANLSAALKIAVEFVTFLGTNFSVVIGTVVAGAFIRMGTGIMQVVTSMKALQAAGVAVTTAGWIGALVAIAATISSITYFRYKKAEAAEENRVTYRKDMESAVDHKSVQDEKGKYLTGDALTANVKANREKYLPTIKSLNDTTLDYFQTKLLTPEQVLEGIDEGWIRKSRVGVSKPIMGHASQSAAIKGEKGVAVGSGWDSYKDEWNIDEAKRLEATSKRFQIKARDEEDPQLKEINKKMQAAKTLFEEQEAKIDTLKEKEKAAAKEKYDVEEDLNAKGERTAEQMSAAKITLIKEEAEAELKAAGSVHQALAVYRAAGLGQLGRKASTMAEEIKIFKNQVDKIEETKVTQAKQKATNTQTHALSQEDSRYTKEVYTGYKTELDSQINDEKTAVAGRKENLERAYQERTITAVQKVNAEYEDQNHLLEYTLSIQRSLAELASKSTRGAINKEIEATEATQRKLKDTQPSKVQKAEFQTVIDTKTQEIETAKELVSLYDELHEYDKKHLAEVKLITAEYDKQIALDKSRNKGQNVDTLEQIKQEKLDAANSLVTPGLDTMAEGWNSTVKKYKDVSTQLRDISASTAESMTQAFSSTFFDVMKGNFKDLQSVALAFVDAVLKQLTTLMAKMAMVKMQDSASSDSGWLNIAGKGILAVAGMAMGSGGVSGSMEGGMATTGMTVGSSPAEFGGLDTAPVMDRISTGGGASFGNYWQPRAKGGPTAKGSTYMVGEEGPEIFVPTENGTIVPNNLLKEFNLFTKRMKNGGNRGKFNLQGDIPLAGHRESGGSVRKGLAYLVGEKGTEGYISATTNNATTNIKAGNKNTDILVHAPVTIEGNGQGNNNKDQSNSNNIGDSMAQFSDLLKSKIIETITSEKRPGGLLSYV